MKFALPVTLALGGLSLVFAILSTFMFYVFWTSQPVTPRFNQQPKIVDIVNSAEDLTRLKKVCSLLAVSQDTNDIVMRTQSALVKRALTFAGLFSVGWGLLSGIVFLYLHFMLRRIIRDGNFKRPTF
jgi:hypothetical protein